MAAALLLLPWLLLFPPAAGAAAAPVAVSVTPSSGTGSSQTFAFLFSDADGANKITYVQALLNASNSWWKACAVLYIQGSNGLYLVNDAGNGWQGPLTPGVAGTLQNSQCTLDAGASSVSAVGNNLTVNAALAFKPAFGGNKVVLLDAEDTVNKLSSGFQSLGTWTVPNSAPVAVSVTPSSGTGSSQTFAFLYSDSGGANRITYAQALINATNSWYKACAILYIQNGNGLYLVNDAGNGWLGPVTPGVAGSLQNSQCTLDAGASSVSAVGNNLTVNAALTFKPAFGGNKVVLLDAEDTVNKLSSGWQNRGTWTVPNSAPVAVSVTPSSGTGSSQTFAFLYSDAGGVGRITYAQALINTSNSWRNACAVLYLQSNNGLYLVNDAGNGWLGPLAPGAAGTLQNTQCTLDAGASSVSKVGNNLTVNVALAFQPAFGGNKIVLLDAENTVNKLSSGWQNLGTWTVLVVTVSPTHADVSPGTTQQFTAAVAGAADTSVAWSIDGHGSGDATVGTVSGTGLYTAPASVPASPNITVRATSNADNTQSATAAVTIGSVVEDWPKYRRDLANTGRSLETFIDSSNASTLKKKWQFTVDTFGGDHKVSASPAVATVGGVRTVYVGAWSGFFYAINAETGAQIWRFEVDRTSAAGATNCTTTSRCRIGSSAAVENDVVYFGAENAYLYALDALDGSLIWKRQLGNPQDGGEIWGSPAVYNGLVYIGLASHNSAPCVAGKMFALNAADGTIAWEFDAVVQATCPSGVCRGAGIWSSPAIDAQFATMFIGTGNPGNSCTPATAKATTEYSDGILGLSLASGTLKSFYRTNANDTTDEGDVGAVPVLHEIESVNECTSTTTTTNWLTVASKDHQVWTGERDANGMPLATSVNLDDLGHAVATTGVLPYSQTQSCGAGNLRQSSNDLFQPTSNGNLYKIRQAFDGTTAQTAKYPINVSGGCATPGNCPLFAPPSSIADMLFFGGGEGNFYGYKGDGTKIFSYGTSGLVASGPAISNGRLYFGSYDGNVYCLSINGQ